MGQVVFCKHMVPVGTKPEDMIPGDYGLTKDGKFHSKDENGIYHPPLQIVLDQKVIQLAQKMKAFNKLTKN